MGVWNWRMQEREHISCNCFKEFNLIRILFYCWLSMRSLRHVIDNLLCFHWELWIPYEIVVIRKHLLFLSFVVPMKSRIFPQIIVDLSAFYVRCHQLAVITHSVYPTQDMSSATQKSISIFGFFALYNIIWLYKWWMSHCLRRLSSRILAMNS